MWKVLSHYDRGWKKCNAPVLNGFLLVVEAVLTLLSSAHFIK